MADDFDCKITWRGFPGGTNGEEPAFQRKKDAGSIPGSEDPLESMAPNSSILAWRIAWTEEPGGLQSTGPHRVGHN